MPRAKYVSSLTASNRKLSKNYTNLVTDLALNNTIQYNTNNSIQGARYVNYAANHFGA